MELYTLSDKTCQALPASGSLTPYLSAQKCLDFIYDLRPTCEQHIQRTTVKDPQLASDEFSEEGSLTFNLNLSPRHLAEKFIHNIAVMDPWNEIKLGKTLSLGLFDPD